MRKHLVDTSVYIDLLRSGAPASFLANLYAADTPGIYFSSVVIEELLAGVIDDTGRRAVTSLYRPFERVGRVLTPSHAIWKQAGQFLAWARQERPGVSAKLPRLTNDALIALSARSIGATVYTSNRDDFELIRSWRPLALQVLEVPSSGVSF